MENNRVDYSLLDNLFLSKSKTVRQTQQDENNMQIETTQKRTFKLSIEFWEDFLILTKIKEKTQAELINELIKQSVLENQEKIENYKNLLK